MSHDPWMEDSNSLDRTDSAEDRVHVPFAFTRDHADWLTADDQANFARGTEASVTQSQADAYAAMAMHDTLCSPLGLDSARPTLVLTDVRAQPSKKDDGYATLETEGDLPHTTAIIQTLMLHRDLITSNQMIYLIVDNRMPTDVPHWPAFAAWWASRRCLVGPQEEATDILWVCADATTGLHKVPYYWAGVFVLEAARFLYPAQHFALIDNDCVPVTLFEVQDLLQLAHQQHQWVDLIGCVRSESSSCAGIGMLLFTEAHLEYNAGLVISIGNRSKHSPLEYDTTASALAKSLQESRLALVSRARPPVNPSDTATAGEGGLGRTSDDFCPIFGIPSWLMPLRDRSGQRWQPSGKPYVVAATKVCSRLIGVCWSLSPPPPPTLPFSFLAFWGFPEWNTQDFPFLSLVRPWTTVRSWEHLPFSFLLG